MIYDLRKADHFRVTVGDYPAGSENQKRPRPHIPVLALAGRRRVTANLAVQFPQEAQCPRLLQSLGMFLSSSIHVVGSLRLMIYDCLGGDPLPLEVSRATLDGVLAIISPRIRF